MIGLRFRVVPQMSSSLAVDTAWESRLSAGSPVLLLDAFLCMFGRLGVFIVISYLGRNLGTVH